MFGIALLQTGHQFDDRKYSEEEIETITIDEFMEQNDIPVVDFMKMDIEGHELVALKGARRAIHQKRIKALTFEFGSGNVNSRTFFHDFWDILHPAGYKIQKDMSGRSIAPGRASL